MPQPGARLFRKWLYSYEEDHDDVRVYWPTDFEFPPSLGRTGIEFNSTAPSPYNPIKQQSPTGPGSMLLQQNNL
jgi:hypothetical protein